MKDDGLLISPNSCLALDLSSTGGELHAACLYPKESGKDEFAAFFGNYHAERNGCYKENGGETVAPSRSSKYDIFTNWPPEKGSLGHRFTTDFSVS